MKLPPGITGFGSSHAVDVRQFRAHLYAAARRVGFSVETAPPDAPPTPYWSFVEGVISLSGEQYRVLVNLYHPFVAFAAPAADPSSRLVFLDIELLPNEFDGYAVLPVSMLEAPPVPDLLANLSIEEQEAVRYWRPQRLGDVIFNWWD